MTSEEFEARLLMLGYEKRSGNVHNLTGPYYTCVNYNGRLVTYFTKSRKWRSDLGSAEEGDELDWLYQEIIKHA